MGVGAKPTCSARAVKQANNGSAEGFGEQKPKCVLSVRSTEVIGEWPSGKATDFDSVNRRFKSYFSNQVAP